MFLINLQVLIGFLFFTAPISSMISSNHGVGSTDTRFNRVNHNAIEPMRSTALRRRSSKGAQEDVKSPPRSVTARSSSYADGIESRALDRPSSLHARTVDSLIAEALNGAASADTNTVPSVFAYCLTDEAGKRKRAEATEPDTASSGCGCTALTGMVWHGVVFGVGKLFRGIGKCFGGCCTGTASYEWHHKPVIEFG